MKNDCHHGPDDWVGTQRTFLLAWGVPVLMLVGAIGVEPSLRALVWFLGLAWMGVACVANAVRCGRTHCYFTGPFFFVMACFALLDGLDLGPEGWSWLGLGLVMGTLGLRWLSEALWGPYRKHGLTRRKFTGGRL